MDLHTPGYFPVVKPFKKSVAARVASMRPPSAPKPSKRCAVCGAAYMWSHCEACVNRAAAADNRIEKKYCDGARASGSFI